MRVYCGLASAGQQIPVAIVDDAGRLVASDEIDDTPAGYAAVCTLIAERCTESGPVRAAMATDSETNLVPLLLAASGEPLAVGDAGTIAQFISEDPPGMPEPRRRAVALARALQAGTLSATTQPAPRDLTALRPVLTAHRAATVGRSASVAMLRDLLRELYPAAVRAFPDLGTPLALAILDRLPDPVQLSAGQDSDVVAQDVVAQLQTAGFPNAGDAVARLRAAVAEMSTRRPPADAVAATVRNGVATVRSADAATAALVRVIAEHVEPRTGARGHVRPMSSPPGQPVSGVPASGIPVSAHPMPSHPLSAQPVTAPPATAHPSTHPAAGTGGVPVHRPDPAMPVSAAPVSASPVFTPPTSAPIGTPAPAASPATAPPGPPGPPLPTATPPRSQHPATVMPAVGAEWAPHGPRPQPSHHSPAPQPSHHSPGPQPSHSGQQQRSQARPMPPTVSQPAAVPQASIGPQPPARPQPSTGPQPSGPAASPTGRHGAATGTSPYATPPVTGGFRTVRDSASANGTATTGAPASSGWGGATGPQRSSHRSPASAGIGSPLADQSDEELSLLTPDELPTASNVLKPTDQPQRRSVNPSSGRLGALIEFPRMARRHTQEPPATPLYDRTRRDTENEPAGEYRPPNQRRQHKPEAPASSPPVSSEGDGDLLIFAQARSAWFTGDHEIVSTSDWRTEADAGWNAAEAASRPTVGGTTGSGLPRRVPSANLVPGAAPNREPEPTHPINRDAAQLAAHTAGYFRGWNRARQDIHDPSEYPSVRHQ